MPGIPRKPYCQPCKRRRVKCDEKWPTCSACKRAGIECPGPSSRIKFVLNNSHKVRGENAADGFASSSESSDGGVPPSTSSGGLILAERPSARARNASEFRSYRLMNVWDRHVSMNSCDRVTARLVTLMDASPQQASSIFRPLQALPSRLSLSECLKDSVAYWCSSWVDYHHGLQAPSRVSWNHYGKLLRSLQRAMQSTQPVTIETTAAATILVKTSEIFSLELFKDRDLLVKQVRGVAALVKLRGIPNMEDPLDVLMAHEQQEMVQMVAVLSPDDVDFYYTPPWKEARAKVIEQIALYENHAAIDVLVHKTTIYFAEYVHDMKLCFKDPSSFSEKAKTIQLEMRKYISNIEFLFPDHWDNAQASFGAIKECADPDFFVGRKYTLQSHQTFEFLVTALFAPIVPCFMVIRLRELYNEPLDIAFENKYREFCTRYWMFIPHLKTQDPLSLGDTFFHYGFTYGVATEQEKGHLADFMMQMDAINEFGKDKNVIINTIHSQINQMIGVPADWTTKKSEPAAEVLETSI